MAIEKIEEYRQQNGVDILKVYCKPTKVFPEGKNYWYAPAEAIDLVRDYTWFLMRIKQRVVLCTTLYDYYRSINLYFHRELFSFYQGYSWNYEIDHINLIDFDNIDENLNAVTYSQNSLNKFSRNYLYNKKCGIFYCSTYFKGKSYNHYNHIKSEDDACIQQNYIEKVWLKEQLDDQYYIFDFKKYRRGSEGILDLERTGQISEEEATYRHILKYSDNAWYMLRYGLEGYYKENHIPIPAYSLDADGFMVHPITGQKLCPL